MWFRRHMERQMLEHIVLDYRTVHRRDGRTNNGRAVRGREGKEGKKSQEQMIEGK